MERDFAKLVRALEPVVKVKMKEEVASCLVRVMQRRGVARRFLTDVVMDEVERTENNSIAFRGNTIATKAMEAYMKLVGEKVRWSPSVMWSPSPGYISTVVVVVAVLEGHSGGVRGGCDRSEHRLRSRSSSITEQQRPRDAPRKTHTTLHHRLVQGHQQPRPLPKVIT